MTVCIAAICEAGKTIVLAADTMITGEDLMIEYEFGSPKIKQLTNNCAVAAAGDATMETDLLRMARQTISELKAPSMDTIVDKTIQTYRALRAKAIEDQILLPHGLESMAKFYETQKTMLEPMAKSIFNDIEEFDLDLDLLIASVDEEGGHITVIEDPGTATTWDELAYHAIGSGYAHADTTLIMRNYDPACSLAEALLSVYTAKKAAEKAPGVGQKMTHMAIVNHHSVTMLNEEQVKQIDVVYQEQTTEFLAWEKEKDWVSKLADLSSTLKS
jgi:20S proteasome alpha/beta subunit